MLQLQFQFQLQLVVGSERSKSERKAKTTKVMGGACRKGVEAIEGPTLEINDHLSKRSLPLSFSLFSQKPLSRS